MILFAIVAITFCTINPVYTSCINLICVCFCVRIESERGNKLSEYRQADSQETCIFVWDLYLLQILNRTDDSA